MLRTLGWVLWLFGYMLVRWPIYWWGCHLARTGQVQRQRHVINGLVKPWARRLLKHIKLTVEVSGTENLPPPNEVVVYAANHQSFLDIPVLLANITPPPALLARREIGKVPLLGGWMRQLDCVFVQRDDARAAMAAFRQADAVLQGGRSLVIFPEGTRAKSNKMGPFLPGAVRIATKAGVPIIPVAISGSYKGLEGNGNRVKKATARLVFLPRVETAGLGKDDAKLLPQLLEQQVRAAKDGPSLPPTQQA